MAAEAVSWFGWTLPVSDHVPVDFWPRERVPAGYGPAPPGQAAWCGQ